MEFTRTTKMLLAAAALTLAPGAAVAQNAADDTTVSNTYDPATDTRTTTVEREEDNDFPIGLLGLLGLAGLLGMRKQKPDVHVDARHNTRP